MSKVIQDSNLLRWNPASKKIFAGMAAVALMTLITGIALSILKMYGNSPTVLLIGGSALLVADMIYLIVLRKIPPTKESQAESQTTENAPSFQREENPSISSSPKVKTSASSFFSWPSKTKKVYEECIEVYKQLSIDEAKNLIFDLLSDTKEERFKVIDFLSHIDEKTKTSEEKAKEFIYKKLQAQEMVEIVKFLTLAEPNLSSYLHSFQSSALYSQLREMAQSNFKSNLEVFYKLYSLLDESNQLVILQNLFSKESNAYQKKIFLELLKKYPRAKIILQNNSKEKGFEELLTFATELLNKKNVESFCDLYSSLVVDQQLACLKLVLHEPKLSSVQVEIIIKTEAALKHPFQFLEFALANRRGLNFSGKRSCGEVLGMDELKRFDKFNLFEAVLPTLPSCHIVSIFWRIATGKLNVWSTKTLDWTIEFQGTKEEKAHIMSLSFDQVSLLNNYHQLWIKLWHPEEQPDEMILETCFKQLKQDTRTNRENFLEYLSLKQIILLIQTDPLLENLNEIFGFVDVNEWNNKNLTDIKHYKAHGHSYYNVSLPSILVQWWDLSEKIKGSERLENLKSLEIEEKYFNFYLSKHCEYEKMRPGLEASAKEFADLMENARRISKEQYEARKKAMEWEYKARKSGISGSNPYSRYNFFTARSSNSKKGHAEENFELPKTEQKRPETPKNASSSYHKEFKMHLEELSLDTKRSYSLEEIQQFTRRSLFKYHPDKTANKPLKEQEECTERFKKISNARDALVKLLEQNKLEKTPVC